MSDRTIEEIEAELAAAKLDQALIDAKATNEGPSPELKAEVREARRAFRQHRAARKAGPGAARPATIGSDAEVQEV